MNPLTLSETEKENIKREVVEAVQLSQDLMAKIHYQDLDSLMHHIEERAIVLLLVNVGMVLWSTDFIISLVALFCIGFLSTGLWYMLFSHIHYLLRKAYIQTQIEDFNKAIDANFEKHENF